MTIIYAIILFGVVVFVHELGHFIFAKLLGVRVERFSIGFGPKLAGLTRGETEYRISAVPLGGYVKMLGEEGIIEDAASESGEPVTRELTEEERKRSFHFQPYWKKVTIIAMGPIFNLLFAVLVFYALFLPGVPRYLPVIGQVIANTPAYSAGLINGDTVTAIDSTPVKTWEDLTSHISTSAGKPLKFTITRSGKTIETTITPESGVRKNIFGEEVRRGQIGIISSGDYIIVQHGVFGTMGMAVRQTWDVCELTVMGIVKIFQRVLPADSIGGPILIYQMAKKEASEGLARYLGLMAVISINLGIVNLFPVPLLDGGHIMFMSIEAAIRRPLSQTFMENAAKVGLALLIMLMVFAFYNDIVRVISGKGLP